MRILVLGLTLALTLTSCVYLPAPPAPTPFPTLTRPPSTPQQPTPTPMPISPLDTPAASDEIFRDDFTISFAGGWDWRGPDPAALSLSAEPGMLHMSVGTAYAFDEGLANLLLRPAPDGDFELETRIVFRPHLNYDFAGLIVYESRDAYLQAGRGQCRGDPGCVGDGIYMDEYSIAQPESGGLRQHLSQAPQLFLRLQRRGQDYTLLASADGAVWWPVGTRQSSIEPVAVGLFAGQAREGQTSASFASFDYFEIREPIP